MTDLIIKDGTGSGNRAKVTDDNKLSVDAVAQSVMNFSSTQKGQAYVISGQENTLVSSSGEYHLLYIKNTDPIKIFHVNQIHVSYNGGNTTGLKYSTARLRFGSSFPGANNVDANVKNLNLTSSNIAIIDAQVWDGVGTGMTISSAGDVAFLGYVRQGITQLPFDGSLILGYNNVLDISLQVAETGLATIVVSGWYA